MEAAAYTVARRPVSVLLGQKPSETVAFVSAVRVGPTSPGNYVIAAQTPLPVPDAVLFANEPPFERRVLLKLYQAIGAAQIAASEALESDDLDAFDDQVENGVSANLCRALARLGGPDSDRTQPRPFDVTFSWACSLPTGVSTVPVRFRPALIRDLDLSADEPGAVPPTGAAVITGTIKKADSDDPSQPGQVQLRGSVRTSPRSQRRERAIWMTLSPEQFNNLALRAIETGERVWAAGELRHTGKRMELDPLRSFDLLGDG